LSAFELADECGAGEASDVHGQVAFQPRDIESQPFGDFTRA
jgi:hypothetical protein